MLLSDAVNVALILMERDDDTVTEQTLTLSCGRCGRVVSADQAAISQEPDCVIYSCPQDGSMIAVVSDALPGGGAFWLHEGDLSLRVGGKEVKWATLEDEVAT